MKAIALVATPTRHRRLNELVGLLLLACAAFLFLAFVSYRPSDPSFNTTGAQAIHNWTGPFGAWLSDALLQLFGGAAYGLPLLVIALAVSWMRSRAVRMLWVKMLGGVLALLSFPTLLALIPGHWQLGSALPLGGTIGSLLAPLLVSKLNLPGAIVVAFFACAIAGYLLSSFSFIGARAWFLVQFAGLAALRDRIANWRFQRARRKEQRREERELEARANALAANDEEEYEEEDELPAPTALRGEQENLTFTAQPESSPVHDKNEAMPSRRGSFAEMSEPSRPVASGWDDDAFAAGLQAASPTPSQKQPAERPQAFAPVPPPKSPEPFAAPRPQLVPGTSRETASPDRITFGERADADQRPVTITAKSVHGFATNFKLPPTTLLHRSEESHTVREEALRTEAQVLVEKCAEFDVGGQVVQINPGPVVTTFEFRPEAGVKYSRVTGLADDLCLAMAAESILIERMAGKSTVGIQVPNSDRETIWLRDVLESENFATSKSRVTMAMGKDINGRIVVADLASMPHVLIAGSTGSGKSVAINAMIMSVLFKATPEQVRLILVDPKRVELGMYEGIPHLFTPIITEPKLAANALKNAVREMERRLKLLASRSVRNLEQYNKLFTDGTMEMFPVEAGAEEEKPLPYIMIIIDELADLMILDKANVEEAITRLAQMARAVGIHLVLATQRPSVDVITGLIKANVPTRMSFRLATKIDSRTILDTNGAESLLGRGDMLFLPPGTSRLQRVHAPFVTEKEIAAVTSFWKAQGTVEYQQGFLDAPRDASGREIDADGDGADDNDPMYDDAVRLVFEFGKASTSLLQRRMRIGYGRAAHLIDLMERDGLVGPPEGSKPREILKRADWANETDEAMR